MGLPWYQITLPICIAASSLVALGLFSAIVGFNPMMRNQQATIEDVTKLA